MGGWHSIRLSLPRRWDHDLIRPGEWAIPCHLHTLGAGSRPGAVDKCSRARRLAVAICGYNDNEKDRWGREAQRRKDHALHAPSSTHGASPCPDRAPYRSDRLVRTGSRAAPDAVERPGFGFSPVAGAWRPKSPQERGSRTNVDGPGGP